MHTHKVTQGFIFFPLQLLQVPTAPVDKIQIVCKLGHVCVRAWVCVCVLEAGRIYVCVMWGWGSMWETNSNSGFVREHIRWEALGCSVSPLKANSVQSCIITELYCRVYPQTTACLPKTHTHTHTNEVKPKYIHRALLEKTQQELHIYINCEPMYSLPVSTHTQTRPL